MYNPERERETTELNDLIEEELREEEANPDYQQWIAICQAKN